MRLLHRLPVFLAVVSALVQIATIGGVHTWDTRVFIARTWSTPWPLPGNSVPPGYPLVLDLVLLLAPPEARMYLLVVLQQATVVASVAMVLGIGTMLGRPWAGWFAALLTVFHLPLGLQAHIAQTEACYVFAVVASAFLFVKGSTRGRVGPLVGSGLAAGFATVLRVVGGSILPTLLLATWLSRGGWKPRITACFTLGFAAVIGTFLFLNHQRNGHADLVSGTGLHLFGRIAMVDRWLPDTAEARLLTELARQRGHESPFYRNAGWDLTLPLTDQLGGDAADALLYRASLQTFRADPLRALRNTIVSMSRIARPDGLLFHLLGDGLGNGLRPAEHLELHRRLYPSVADPYGSDYTLIPPYPPPALLGRRPFAWIEAWQEYVVLLRGDASLIAMALAGLIGLLLRNRYLLLFSGLALGQIFVAALGDQPMIRYFDPSAIPFYLALVWTPVEIARAVQGRGRGCVVPPVAGTYGGSGCQDPAAPASSS